jgi:perosamine synthetase
MTVSIALFGVMHDTVIEQAAAYVLRSGQIASGPAVEQFRRRFGAMIGNDNVATTSDMSSAMTIALRLAGAGPGTEVISMPFACLSTNAPIAGSGTLVRWADMNPATGAIDLDDVARLITPRTRALVLYHVAGYPGPAAAAAALCRDAGIRLIEDCDNALGATIDGMPVGSFGDHAIYSFYPNRQINGIEGGAITCRSASELERAVRLRRFGIDPARFRDGLGEIDPACDVAEIGWAATMSNLNSAVARSQLDGVAFRLARTQQNAHRLAAALDGLANVRPLTILPGALPAYWVLGVHVGGRDACLAPIKAAGVAVSRLHHRNDGYSAFGPCERRLRGVDAFTSTNLYLPCGWWLDDGAIDRVAEVVATVARTHGASLPA